MSNGSVEKRLGPDPVPAAHPFRHVLSRPSFYRLGFFMANRIPRPILYSTADFVGDASRICYRARERNVRENLRRAFPEAAPGDLDELAKRIFRNYARSLVDFGRYHGMTPDALRAEISRVDGVEHIERTVRSGRGAILVTGHIGNWELGGLYFVSRGLTLNVVGLPDIAPEINAIRDDYRKRYDIRTILLDGSPFSTLEMMAALRRGEVVAMLVDRWGNGNGVAAELFGKPHVFPRGPFVLSRATGATIVPGFVVRNGRSYLGVFEEPFVAESRDDAAYARIVARSLERVIREHPDQWYNFERFPDDPPRTVSGEP
jgi:lauroyl/myristoyl acyltransferase